MRYRIFQNGVEINTIEAGQPFVSDYCQRNSYTFDEAPDPEQTVEERLDTLEDALAQTDETAIALYEANEEQSQINAAQDEALIEIYEMMEG